ncbi:MULTISPECIES: rhodanese-like domain-containing protein [Exiguobacterium]|uniref:rhodanese-like domain-containing protein n=1 Tax=Exiguobacterium TaxID=33986 RepID=UPI0008776B5F|nr:MULTISPECIES: rhodanese-like domain-containing protein [Exiguobacterium]TCI37688.1 rhodanese-like domain-containing protein [Exiguobacterium sp. SH4S7]TCI46023.1 rhodanese-like domain-containing protein [Exiguobacterium sp. SH5S32]TCI51779.1 rhodanese-like domain-containing protein [Exiguobacterium sp. SH1S4]TCI53583.1 rhodanese-like domain-containing protein [Exiguobacterium sp. SH5S13]TCI65795.1 rhodanese-like domain-containing protein [Exiguobacterium sp. SH0S2]
MKTITTTELETLLSTDETLNLIDVRETDEFAGGHIKQAKNVPLSDFSAKVDELDRTKPIHVICAAGGRSMNASAYLDSLGFDVINVDGGMMSWTGETV